MIAAYLTTLALIINYGVPLLFLSSFGAEEWVVTIERHSHG